MSRLVDGRWLEVGIFVGDARVRAEPFETVEVSLGDWWELLPPEPPPEV